MSNDLGIEDIAREQDTDRLWRALLAAKADGHHRLVRLIENRMRELSTERRFDHLSDDELRSRLAAIDGHREHEGLIIHSPDNDGSVDPHHVQEMNRRIREGQHVGAEATRSALLDELRRREVRGDA